ncbi:hypothetical protein CLOM_g17988 [Closterium sp. NIES-68]|nr:hypothetical protein CLOM_g17988 [Closterium sp. NIES-68]GJP70110.1 hypothetical protein CLOP_g1095 [Closterium sp. NIES-67]
MEPSTSDVQAPRSHTLRAHSKRKAESTDASATEGPSAKHSCPSRFSTTFNVFDIPTGPLLDHFTLEPTVLGAGQYGTVRQCADKLTGQRFACKTIQKSRLVTEAARAEVRREVALMSRVAGHPGVVGLRAVFEDDKEVHLVMDLCEGGELFDEVVRFGRLSERDAALIFRQLASGVAFCHSRGVLHRDLKPENILLHRSAPSGAVPASPAATSALAAPESLESRGLTAKLADFGLSIALDNGRVGYGTAGSPFYMAPEVLTGEYEYAADVWSLGVILYIMLCGRPPFWGKTDAAVYDAILRGKLDFSGAAWTGVSVEARSLIRCMLQSDPRRRPTAVKVLSHPWVLLHLYGIRAVRTSAAGGEDSLEASAGVAPAVAVTGAAAAAVAAVSSQRAAVC